jgi:REP element-mobilizing transposase RayT
VTFHLSKDNVLTAEARDLDSGRHHVWQENDGAMIVGEIKPEDLKDGIARASA